MAAPIRNLAPVLSCLLHSRRNLTIEQPRSSANATVVDITNRLPITTLRINEIHI